MKVICFTSHVYLASFVAPQKRNGFQTFMRHDTNCALNKLLYNVKESKFITLETFIFPLFLKKHCVAYNGAIEREKGEL